MHHGDKLEQPGRGCLGVVAHASDNGCNQGWNSFPALRGDGIVGNSGGAVAHAANTGTGRCAKQAGRQNTGNDCYVGYSQHSRLEGLAGHGHKGAGWPESDRSIAAAGFWGNAEWLICADGKARPIEPGIPLLAHGIPNRVGKLRGYGNAIVPQVAAQFIKATM